VIDPARMPLTRLANSIIDGVTASANAVAAEVEKYLGSDLLFYRAEGPERLVARQQELWDPIVAWARTALGARFELVEGVIHVAQPLQSIKAAAAAIPRDPWRLGAVHSLTDGLRPDCARTRPQGGEPRRRLDRGACRRRLEHGTLGA
jgi:chaperone required for assembly of F1-ATPase